MEVISILKESIFITGFVFAMMLVVEYINVQTKGVWSKMILKSRWKQYFIAAFLGAIPGCLGAFTIITLFSHRVVSFGALVTTLVATSGDEAFVMFGMFPKKALFITGGLLLLGVIAGYITDLFYTPKKIFKILKESKLPLHSQETSDCHCFNAKDILKQLQALSLQRGALIVITFGLLFAIQMQYIADDALPWIKNTLLVVLGFATFIVLTVPEHFLEEHLWKHIVCVHIPRIFLWTFGTLLLIAFLMQWIDVELWVTNNMFFVLLLAVMIGILPESGPHLVFVTLFMQGTIPISILLASSISQDGHASLPLLAESKKGFLMAKLINVVFALIIGLVGYFLKF
jgi:hypothetical protein